MYKILLVEDDLNLCEIITDYFIEKSEGTIKITGAQNGARAQELLYEESFDIVFLDVMLPDTEGFAVCKSIRAESDVPIIFITARHSEEDVLYGYSLGCDDYISKPFSLARLFAKAEALIRRSKGMIRENVMSAGEISLNPYRCRAYAGSSEISLAPKEYALLKLLLENKNRAVSRETLLIKIWGYDYGGSERVVDDHIRKLRAALGKAGKQIKTVIKHGYKLEG